MDLPIKFKNKVTNPPSGNKTGYPYRISASDLDANFAYAALDADSSWIETISVGDQQGRKLRLPPIPAGVCILMSDGGNPYWSEYKEIEVSICENNYEKTGTILFRES
jgi:hypothetical protein